MANSFQYILFARYEEIILVKRASEKKRSDLLRLKFFKCTIIAHSVNLATAAATSVQQLIDVGLTLPAFQANFDHDGATR